MAHPNTVPNTRFDKKPNSDCLECGKKFFRMEAEKKRYKNSFCSRVCMGKWYKVHRYGSLNQTCDSCGTKYHKSPSLGKGKIYELSFCCRQCMGDYYAANFSGDKSSNWQGGKTALRQNEITGTPYRTWRRKLLNGAECVLCTSKIALELHHIESRKDAPLRIRDESNVVPMCEECHDLFHSNSRKGEELRERLKAIVAQDNPQPSPSEDGKVQRLTGEDKNSNKPDTSIARESDEIVRADSKESDAGNKMSCDNKSDPTQTIGFAWTQN